MAEPIESDDEDKPIRKLKVTSIKKIAPPIESDDEDEPVTKPVKKIVKKSEPKKKIKKIEISDDEC